MENCSDISDRIEKLEDELNKLRAEQARKTAQEFEREHEFIAIPANDDKGVEEFTLSKYPTTRGQFNKFLQDSQGYHNDQWWAGFPAGCRKEERKVCTDKLDHPMTEVNWFEAAAYCRWLSKRLGKDLHLPSEAQWYQAATGGDEENVYPWGKEMEEDRCNSYESGIGGTTPVDKYPKGATKQGVMDMSGNTWEWCEDEYK